ncbi:MAG: MinD/ParA family protein [Planctomycetes bacterium]|nr:MinD/ParA family protein [Planctomycetota bacterium]
MNCKDAKYLESVMSAQSQKTRVIAITSGKGGVGKTNIAANLAICLAASNKKVVLFDADLGLGNIDVIMNINSRYNLTQVISGQKELHEIINIAHAGVDVICAGSGIAELANINQFQLQRLIDELEELENNTDILIIDTGAGISNTVMNFCTAADNVLVVTTPEPTAMTDAYAMIKVLAARNFDGRISLVVNMANSIPEGKRIYRQVADVAMRFLNLPVYEAGIICKNDQVTKSVKSRKPVVLNYPKAKVTSEIAAMAARLSRNQTPMKKKNSFFKRVVNCFF